MVDDDSRLRTLWVEALRTAGYAAVGAQDGLIASGLIRDLMPDLIILDLRMPHASGRDVLENLRTPPWQKIPLLIVSGYLEEELGTRRRGDARIEHRWDAGEARQPGGTPGKSAGGAGTGRPRASPLGHAGLPRQAGGASARRESGIQAPPEGRSLYLSSLSRPRASPRRASAMGFSKTSVAPRRLTSTTMSAVARPENTITGRV